MKTIHIDIVSAETALFSGDATMVVASGILGELGVVHGHAPLLTQLQPGEVRVTKTDGSEHVFYISGGIMEIQPEVVTVLADEAERAEALDEERALQAKHHAEQVLSSKGSNMDHHKAAAELARAVAQIRAIQKVRKMC